MKDWIDKIEDIRSWNNKNWMDVLRLAVQYAPKEEVKQILREIVDHDIKISQAMKTMLEEMK